MEEKNQFQLIRSVFILLGIEEKLMTSNWFMGSKVVDHQSPIKNAKAGQSLKVEKQLFTRFCWQIEGIPAKDIFADTFLQRTLSSGSEMRKKTFQKNVENVWRKYWVPSNIRVYEVHFRKLPKQKMSVQMIIFNFTQFCKYFVKFWFGGNIYMEVRAKKCWNIGKVKFSLKWHNSAAI